MKSKLIKRELTEDEWELIEAIRNYKASYPNGYPNLFYYVQQKFDELTDIE